MTIKAWSRILASFGPSLQPPGLRRKLMIIEIQLSKIIDRNSIIESNIVNPKKIKKNPTN